ncbi:hypothetical protein DL765_009016 [Monosporascus sp. GIB2]|nr:hypothetical protein DL765_009016 [Monosporascus sp. GIB2]
MSSFYIENKLVGNRAEISGYNPLTTPDLLEHEIPQTTKSKRTVLEAREEVVSILTSTDAMTRLLVIIGPCSIHDPVAALEYGDRLIVLKKKYKDDLLIVMRSCIERPTSAIAWKGLINDPDIDGSYRVNKGLRLARQLFVDLTDKGMPIASEMLGIVSPSYLADLLSVGAVGSGTTESEWNRELASGLGFPVGFQTGTDGMFGIAVRAVGAAKNPYHYLSVTKPGVIAVAGTIGNEDCFVIPKGYYNEESIAEAKAVLEKAGLRDRLMVDCSQTSPEKNHETQQEAAANLASQISNGETGIMGVMIKSNIMEGNQKVPKEGKVGLSHYEEHTFLGI